MRATFLPVVRVRNYPHARLVSAHFQNGIFSSLFLLSTRHCPFSIFSISTCALVFDHRKAFSVSFSTPGRVYSTRAFYSRSVRARERKFFARVASHPLLAFVCWPRAVSTRVFLFDACHPLLEFVCWPGAFSTCVFLFNACSLNLHFLYVRPCLQHSVANLFLFNARIFHLTPASFISFIFPYLLKKRKIGKEEK